MSTVLIIEDDDAILTGLREALEGEHYDVLFATDGTSGERMARERKPDLIILDLMLPGKNGEDICKSLRSDGIATPIIINQPQSAILPLPCPLGAPFATPGHP